MSQLNYHGTALSYFQIMTILLALTSAFVRFLLCQNDLEERGKHNPPSELSYDTSEPKDRQSYRIYLYLL